MPRKRSSGAGRNRLRIIGGAWRGHHLRFPDAADLRPTADRLRETLFNWLAPVIEGAQCLDLFAGSGALGFEAASRGAGRVVMVDASRRVAAALEENAARLGADSVEVACTSAERFLAAEGPCFDIVFVDPPFHRPELAVAACAALSRGGLAPGARIYLETASRQAGIDLPPGWELLRESRVGDAIGRLYLASD